MKCLIYKWTLNALVKVIRDLRVRAHNTSISTLVFLGLALPLTPWDTAQNWFNTNLTGRYFVRLADHVSDKHDIFVNALFFLVPYYFVCM